MSNYANLVVKTCHRRKALAIGGMAAFIPVKSVHLANEAATEKVRQDKLREVSIGHDGTWVAHPGLVPLAMSIFNENMPTPNQISRQRDDFNCSAADLLQVPKDSITEGGYAIISMSGFYTSKVGCVAMVLPLFITSWKTLLRLKSLARRYGNGLKISRN